MNGCSYLTGPVASGVLLSLVVCILALSLVTCPTHYLRSSLSMRMIGCFVLPSCLPDGLCSHILLRVPMLHGFVCVLGKAWAWQPSAWPYWRYRSAWLGQQRARKSGPLVPTTLALICALCLLLPLLTYVLATLLLLPLPCSILLTLFDSGADCVDFVCTCSPYACLMPARETALQPCILFLLLI